MLLALPPTGVVEEKHQVNSFREVETPSSNKSHGTDYSADKLTAAFDVYESGIILLQISLWKTVNMMIKTQDDTAELMQH